jgi:hypothetical protein
VIQDDERSTITSIIKEITRTKESYWTKTAEAEAREDQS